MASFSTTISVFNDGDNARTYSLPGNTVALPRLLVQKRKQPKTSTNLAEDRLLVLYGSTDDDGTPLASKVVIELNVRRPANAQSADVTAALAVARDFIASDEVTAMVSSQDYVQ
jgi:hypothetical protein